MGDKDKSSPATTSMSYDVMRPRWDMIEALVGGTETMRAAAETYLPQHSAETSEDYNERLSSAVLTNRLEQTLDTLSSKPFQEPVKFSDIPSQLEALMVDLDLSGNDVNVFARKWFKEALAKAFAHVLVDYPKTEPKADGSPRTMADDQAEGVRPYCVFIKPENVLFASASMVQGREALTHVRILESKTVMVGFAQEIQARIRVLEPGSVTIYRPEKKGNGKVEWSVEDQWATGLTFIPLVTAYADRTDLMEGKPPLADLAYLNIQHWQKASDRDTAIKVASFPVLACSGASKEDGDPIVIGPKKILYNSDPNGRFYYVESNGTQLKAGLDDISKLEQAMDSYGAEFLRNKPGNQTATGRAIDSAESNSNLATFCVEFEDAFATVLSYMAQWMKVGDSGGRIELVKKFTTLPSDKSLDALLKLREKKDISRKAVIKEAVRRGVLEPDFDEEADMEEIEHEIEESMARSLTDLDEGASDEEDPSKKPGKKPGENMGTEDEEEDGSGAAGDV